MSRLAAQFSTCRVENRAALVTFVTAGDPDHETSRSILHALPAAGADIIELGVAFTDPMADGPAIQLGNIRALGSGISLRKTLSLVSDFRISNQHTPIILMGYVNPLLAYGVEAFAADASAAGVDGLILVDLPPEEDVEVGDAVRRAGLDIIRLATPTTDAQRLPAVLEGASGFVYYVSMTGVTGTRDVDADAVARDVTRIKASTSLPVAVGFGVKTPEQATAIARHADAVVVGSAIVATIGEAVAERANDVADRVSRQVRALADAVRNARKGIA